jgi:NADH-quinone oxidoreductase subunit M
MPTLLIVLLALPLATAAAVALLGLSGRRPEAEDAPGPYDGAIRWVSLGSTVTSLVLAAVVACCYAATPQMQDRPPGGGFQPQMVPGASTGEPSTTTWEVLTFGPWSDAVPSVRFYVGIDGLNVWLVLLTSLLMVPAVLVSWKSIERRVPEFYAWLLLLQMAMVGVFLAFDIVLFYVFFELTLVPLFFLIGIWGGPQRQYAAYKFFLYTLAGSLFTLLGVLGIALTLAQDGPDKKFTFSIPELVRQADRHARQLEERLNDARKGVEAAGEPSEVEARHKKLAEAEQAYHGWQRVQFWVFLAMMAGFAIKVPLVPLHTWLPLAHTEAPTAGSVLLAGVLLKIGGYGFLRLCLPLVPDASLRFGAPVLGALAVAGVLYGSFCALAQHDIKKLVAYSSVAHMGYCILGLFALNEVGLSGGLVQMLSHGLSTGAMFLLVGMLYDRYHTRKISDYGGMGKKLHLLAVFWVFITLSSIGLPGLNGFVGEALVLLGMYNFEGPQVDGRWLAGLSLAGVVLSAWYMLTLLLRVFFGEVREPAVHGHGPVPDLDGRELAALVPIALACLALGTYPKPVLDSIGPDVRVIAGIAADARQRAADE